MQHRSFAPPRPSIRGSDGHEDTLAQLGLARLKNLHPNS